MNEAISLVNLDWKVVITGLIIIIFGVVAVMKAFDYLLFDKIGIETRKMREDKQVKEDLKYVMDQVKQIDDKRIEDNKEIKTAINNLSSNVNELREMVAESKEHEREARVAQIKDTIGKSYRKYHESKCWTSMEKEALEGLIRTYTRSGGNSFVHSTVEPEMHTWKVIDE